jgi:hypothetical protein
VFCLRQRDSFTVNVLRFSRGARKNEAQKKIKYHAAAGKAAFERAIA